VKGFSFNSFQNLDRIQIQWTQNFERALIPLHGPRPIQHREYRGPPSGRIHFPLHRESGEMQLGITVSTNSNGIVVIQQSLAHCSTSISISIRIVFGAHIKPIVRILRIVRTKRVILCFRSCLNFVFVIESLDGDLEKLIHCKRKIESLSR
jgi:hypothetical protein